ncbi:nitrogenase cofactor biosynthesis protein NifB [Bacillota bacterium LX-D]|nr:nitrogenase cofactor biosynthesis protein NifB [Bacillota bacterium LX-D]
MLPNIEETQFREMVAGSTAQHPCYSAGAHEYARIHVPVAPVCNIQCNYCNRKYDCANESRPGVTNDVLNPKEALERFIHVRQSLDNLKVVGIAGPGDALAEFGKTKETITLIREYDPNITICLSTNGLMLPKYVNEIIGLGVGHVTITINAVDPAIGKMIYSRVNYEGLILKGEGAAARLMENQLQGLRQLSNSKVVCKVNIVMIKGINDHHIEDIVKTVKDNGAYITNIMPMIQVAETPFEHIPAVSHEEIYTMRKKCEKHIQQMYHCRQCRADAIGTLGNDLSLEFRSVKCKAEPLKKIS